MQQDAGAGILTQTLASSPCIKSILSARIRTPLHSDVVMVSHSSIHLREFTHTGHLSNIIADLELGIQILAAKVISAEEYVLSTADAILENGRDEIRYKIRGILCDDSQPPQIVVLSVATSELVFAYAKTLSNGNVQFIHARRHILGGLHWPRKYGRHLAIDPQSRAMAVASAKGSFGILALKHVDQIKADIDSWDPRDPTTIQPIKEQRFVQVDGVILRMDFLRSSAEDPQRVVLLLIVANQGTTRLLLYRWDSWRELNTIKPLRCSGQPLPVEDAFPHLLIPSSRWTSFAIVTGPKMVFYDNVNAKTMKRHPVSIPMEHQLKDKHWVQYAQPARHEAHKKRKEDIFLIREDGMLKSIVVTHSEAAQNSISFDPGHLGIHVDTAVCALSAPPTMGGDILIACGDTTEGGVFHLAATQKPILLQSLPNWSPISDVVCLKQELMSSIPHDHGAVLAATGLHEQRATLTELRYGIESQVMWTIRLEDAASIDHLWVLERATEGCVLFLASHHEHTTMLSYDPKSTDVSFVDSVSCPQLCFESRTLSTCTLPGGTVVQITTSQINVLTAYANHQVDSGVLLSAELTCADTESSCGVFVAVKRAGHLLEMIGGIIVVPDGADPELSLLSIATPIDYIPVELKIGNLSERTICISGSQDGRLYLYDMNPENGFAIARSWALNDFAPSLRDTSISSISLLSLSHARSAVVICGLKTGWVMLFELTIPASGQVDVAELRLDRLKALGATAATIRTESYAAGDNERSVYVVCGSRLLRVKLHRSKHGLDYTVTSLFIIDKTNPSYIPPPISAIDRVAKLTSPCTDDPSGLLACVAGNEILLLKMGQETMLPRPVRVMQPTKHLVYSSQLRKCVVSVQAKSPPTSPTDSSQHLDLPYVQLIDPNTSPEMQSKLPKSHFYFGEKGEKIRVLLVWTPTDGKTHHEWLIIGSDTSSGGRLFHMRVSRMRQSKLGSSATLFAEYSKRSINAICAYGMSSLVVCAGRELKLLHLDMAAKRWHHAGFFELPSRATELKTKGSVIYVATALHSFMLLREDHGQLTPIGCDDWAGRARNILPYGERSTLINLVSDHGSRILNFSGRPNNGSKPASEATIPQAIDRLVPFEAVSQDDQRDRFLGSTIDGTVYLFTMLSSSDLKLLRYLERLCEPIRDQAAKSASALAHAIAKKYANKLESSGITSPSLGATHARGDVLKALLEPGPYNIHFLLHKRVKVEGEDAMVKQEDELESLTAVALPVLGKTDDAVEGVVAWLRRLLNGPSW